MSVLGIASSGAWREWAHSVPQLVRRMETFTADNPSLVQMEQIGETVQGRPIHALSVGNPEAKHSIFVSAGVHGGEIVTPHVLIESLEDLVREAGENRETAELLRNVQFRTVPLVNSDSLDASITRGINQRTNAADLHDPTSLRWPHGSDLNRNMPHGWVPENANLACRHGHHGLAPVDQPETRAITELIDREVASGRLRGGIDLHSFLPAALWEGGSEIGRQFASHAASITGYGMQASDAFYPAPGTVLSYIASKGVPAQTLEVGRRHKPDFDEAFDTYERVREVLRFAGLMAKDPQNTLIAPLVQRGSARFDAATGQLALRGEYPVNMMFEGNSRGAVVLADPADPIESGIELAGHADDAVIDYAGRIPASMIQDAGPGDARRGVFIATRNHLGGMGPVRFQEVVEK